MRIPIYSSTGILVLHFISALVLKYQLSKQVLHRNRQNKPGACRSDILRRYGVDSYDTVVRVAAGISTLVSGKE